MLQKVKDRRLDGGLRNLAGPTSSATRYSQRFQKSIVQLLRGGVLRNQRRRIPHKRIAGLLLRLFVKVMELGVDQDALTVRIQEQVSIQRSPQDKRCRHLPVADHLPPGWVVLRS